MRREQESYFAMTLKVKNFYTKNSTAMTSVPAVTGYYTQLNSLITDFITADTGSLTDLTGYAIVKSKKRKTLETQALKVSNAMASYAAANNDTVLLKKVDFPTSNWTLYTEDQLISQVTIVKNLATPIAANLAPFGATAADVTAIGTVLTAFTDVISDPTLAIDQRKNDNIKITTVIDQIRTLFDEKLDILMRSFEVNSGSLYSLYKSARAIDINGATEEPTVVTDILPNSIMTAHKAAGFDANTFYTLQNKGNEPVTFSLSTVEGQEGPEPVMLNAGETRSRLAENLAPAGTYLMVKNASDAAVKIRIWVE